jgi:hypothetical protein
MANGHFGIIFSSSFAAFNLNLNRKPLTLVSDAVLSLMAINFERIGDNSVNSNGSPPSNGF